MTRRPLFSGTIRNIFILLLLIALIPVVLIQAVIYYGLYRARLANEALSEIDAARAVSLAFNGYIRDVLRDEQAIGLTVTSSLQSQPGKIEQYLIANAAEYPAIDAFFWVDEHGTVLATGEKSFVGESLADREFFQQITSGKPWAVSDLFFHAEKASRSF